MKLTRHHVECIYIFNNKDLSWLDLSGLDLSDLYLTDVNLKGSNLRYANLYRANLVNANLTEANIERTDLTGANLTEANLVNAKVRGANLSYANLTSANLERTNLYNANINNSCLFNCIGNGKEIVTLQTPYYTVNMTKDFMIIGCKTYTYEEWFSFSDDEINDMADKALEFWHKYKNYLLDSYKLNFGE